MVKIALFIIMLTSSVLSTKAHGQMIPLVGMAENGRVVESVITEKAYSDQVKKSLAYVEESTLQALYNKDENRKTWALRTVVVGVGVNAEIGLGPIIKFGVLPRFRVGFSNAKEPSFP